MGNPDHVSCRPQGRLACGRYGWEIYLQDDLVQMQKADFHDEEGNRIPVYLDDHSVNEEYPPSLYRPGPRQVFAGDENSHPSVAKLLSVMRKHAGTDGLASLTVASEQVAKRVNDVTQKKSWTGGVPKLETGDTVEQTKDGLIRVFRNHDAAVRLPQTFEEFDPTDWEYKQARDRGHSHTEAAGRFERGNQRIKN